MSSKVFSKEHFNWTSVGFSAIWLVFLVYPITNIWAQQSLELWQKWLATTATIIFCIVYLASFGANTLVKANNQTSRTLKWSLILLVPALVMGVFVGPWSVYFITYFVAKWAFQNKPSVGIPVGAALTLIGYLVIAWVLPPRFASSGYSFLFGAIFVLIFASLTWRAEQRRDQAQLLEQAQTSERIARDVHDLLGHTLTVINLKAEVASALVEQNPSAAQEELAQINALSRTALAEVRATVTRMKSPNFAGEVRAAQKALETANITFHLPTENEIAKVGNNSALFTWVLRESITNVLRHSHATQCWVYVEPERIEIMDNGQNATIETGNGLSGLRARVQEAGGDLTISFGSQTRIMASMNGIFTPMGSEQ